MNMPLKYSYWFMGIIFSLLSIFAIVFYFERLNSDAGYYFFHSLNSGWFHVEHGRLVLIPAEFPAVLGSRLHLPLQPIAVLYSLNHVLFPALLASLCIIKFRNMNAGLLITLLQYAGLRFAVVTPQFELFYGLSLLIFFFAFLQFHCVKRTASGLRFYSIFTVLLIFILSAHPMAVYCWMAGMLLFYRHTSRASVWLPAILIFASYLIWKFVFISEYEASKFSLISNDSALQFMQWEHLKNGLSLLFRHYPDAMLLLAGGMVYLFRRKEYLSLIIYIAAIIGCVILIWMMFPPGEVGRYIEQVYFPFVFLTCLCLYKISINRYVLIALSLLFVYRFTLMSRQGLHQKARTEQMAIFTNKAQQQPGSKFYVTEADMGKAMYEQGNWSYGFETMFYSAMHNEKTVTITKLEDLEYRNNMFRLRADEFLFRPFDILPDSALNQHYFNLKDGTYLLLMNKP